MFCPRHCSGKQAQGAMEDQYLCHLHPNVCGVLYGISVLTSQLLGGHSTRCKTVHTLNDAEYGTPIGKFAKMASALLALTPLNARLCVISWIAKKRFWFAVPPMV